MSFSVKSIPVVHQPKQCSANFLLAIIYKCCPYLKIAGFSARYSLKSISVCSSKSVIFERNQKNDQFSPLKLLNFTNKAVGMVANVKNFDLMNDFISLLLQKCEWPLYRIKRETLNHLFLSPLSLYIP